MLEQTPIPPDELEIFKGLKDLKVIFDVGARVDTDYLELWPDSEHHLFEPNPEFFDELERRVATKFPNANVHLNKFGLSDKVENLKYDPGIQSFRYDNIGETLPLSTLDGYIAQKGIERIDFLKIDTEGLDYKVLVGGAQAIKKCRYIQYEHWDDRLVFHDLLDTDFIMCYTGWRNVLCIRKGEPWP